MGVGMPAALLLDEFGSQVWAAFGSPPYLVGSALAGKAWRDVDVRMILDDDLWDAMGLGDPKDTHRNAKWVSLCLAYSALGKAMTGLPIDFQLRRREAAEGSLGGQGFAPRPRLERRHRPPAGPGHLRRMPLGRHGHPRRRPDGRGLRGRGVDAALPGEGAVPDMRRLGL